jgi:hypothetical protein
MNFSNRDIETLTAIVSIILEQARKDQNDWRDWIGFAVTLNGVTYRNRGMDNNNPWDLFLVKAGTQGATRKTGFRISLKKPARNGVA